MRLPLPGGRLHPRSPRPSPQQARDPHSSAYSPFGIEIKLKQNRPWRVALSAPVRLRGRSRSERKKAFLRKSFAFGVSGFPPSALEGPPRCHGCWGPRSSSCSGVSSQRMQQTQAVQDMDGQWEQVLGSKEMMKCRQTGSLSGTGSSLPKLCLKGHRGEGCCLF